MIKTRTLLGISLLCFLLISLYFFLKPNSKQETGKTSNPKTFSKQEISEILSRALTKKSEILDPKIRDCGSLRDLILFKNAIELPDLYRTGSLQISEQCREEIPNHLSEQIATTCAKTYPPGSSDPCLASLLMLKASLVRKTTHGQAVSTLNTQELLLAAIGAMLSANDDSQALYMRDAADELLRRRELENVAHKLKVSSFLFNPDDRIHPDHVFAFTEATTSAYQQFPNDVEIRELFLARSRFTEDPANLVNTYSQHVKSNPTDALGYYYLASAYWKNGDRESAIAQLSSALQLDPKNERFQGAYASAQTKPIEEPIFSISIFIPF